MEPARGRPRTERFDRALRAEVRDALWMLSKQWQMGELIGDDAGSPVIARAHLETTRLTRYQAGSADGEPFDPGVPLEVKVEPWVARCALRGELGSRAFLAWNLVGALIIVPAAPILLQLGLPGPLYVFQGPPDARAVFAFPMSIAPMIGVPLFVLTNLCVAWRLWVRRRRWEAGSPVGTAPAVAR